MSNVVNTIGFGRNEGNGRRPTSEMRYVGLQRIRVGRICVVEVAGTGYEFAEFQVFVYWEYHFIVQLGADEVMEYKPGKSSNDEHFRNLPATYIYIFFYYSGVMASLGNTIPRCCKTSLQELIHLPWVHFGTSNVLRLQTNTVVLKPF